MTTCSAWTSTPLGQKIGAVERWGIVPVRRNLGTAVDELHSQKEAHLKVGAFETHSAARENRLIKASGTGSRASARRGSATSNKANRLVTPRQ
jgi:hypothetical protein